MLHAIGPLHRALSRSRGSLIHRPTFRPRSTAYLGSDYGGWTVIPEMVGPELVVYSVGVGSDITFDRAMIERFGCTVHAFDPTPMAREWVAKQTVPARIRVPPDRARQQGRGSGVRDDRNA